MAYSIELKQKALAYLDQCGNISAVYTAYEFQEAPCMLGLKNKNKGICPVKVVVVVVLR